jgi:AraC-like DNA-binding protein
MEKYFVDLVRPETQAAADELLPDGLDNGVIYSRSPESLRRTFEELLEFGGADSQLGDEICTKALELLLLKIRESSIDHRLTRSPAFAAYRRCRLIIESRFLELTTAGEVAALANVDVSYLCRLFSRFDVQSPYKILTRLRMNYAAGMLVREGMSVKHTAMELGYKDPFTFSRLFKSTMGLSPQNFAETYVNLENIVG